MQPPPPPPAFSPVPRPPSTGPDPVRTVVGLLLLVPAAIALLVGYVLPTLWTVTKSFQAFSPLPGSTDDFVGLENYEQVAERIPGPIAFALLSAFVPLLALVVVAPLLAWLAHRWGRAGRVTTRLALTLPMVCFVPVALAVGWRIDRFDVETLRLDLLLAMWLSGFGLACAVGVTCYLAALRRRELPATDVLSSHGPPAPATSAWPAVLTVGGLAVITMVAIGLQAFTHIQVTGGGPNRETTTLMYDLFRSGFQQFRFGSSAAEATILLVLLMALGLAAALLAILTGLRIELEPSRRSGDEPPGGGAGAAIGTAAGLVAVLAVTGYGLWPWLSRLGGLGEGWESVAVELLVNTWLAPLVSTVVGVGMAAVAAFGIGWLRPLGRWSELLLLPFAPWLFIGIGPLVLARYESADDRFGTFAGLIPPVWVVVPALFLLTLLFRGLERRQRELGAGGTRPGDAGRAVLAALPMLALVAGATWLVQAQSLLWQVTAGFSQATSSGWVFRQARAAFGEDLGFGLVLPIPAIAVLAAVLAVLQVLYLERLAIRVDHRR